MLFVAGELVFAHLYMPMMPPFSPPPIKEDIDNLATILMGFGEVTGLVTNVQKSVVVPIRCEGLNLNSILHGFLAACASFPMHYLGLPFSVHCLRSIDFQPLVAKIANKLWRGKLFMAAGRCTLFKSIMASQAIYHLTSFVVPRGTMEAIKKIERAFM